MKLKIDQKTLEDWKAALVKAKDKEVGGVLFGEHLGERDFQLIEFTQQRRRGDVVSFRRKGREAKRSLKRLSAAHGNDHTRFNYLGEWHSHPNAPAVPSQRDCLTMQNLLADPKTDAHFLVLIILRINGSRNIEMSANAFLASGHILECAIEIENTPKEPQHDRMEPQNNIR